MLHKLTFGDLVRMAADGSGGAGDGDIHNHTGDATGQDNGGTGDADPAKDSGKDKKPATEEKTFTQAELDTIIADRLKREKEKAELAAKKAEEEAERKKLEEQGQYKEALEAEKKKREEAEEKARLLEVNAIKARVAAKHNLPEPLVLRLQGETEEEIEADAKSLAGALPAPSLNNDANRGSKVGDSTPQRTEEEIQEFAARYGVKPEHVKQEFFKVPKK